MELHKILDSLKDFNLQKTAESGMSAYIRTYKIIKPRQTSFSPTCLYVGYVSELPPKLLATETGNLICIADAPLPPDFFQSENINLYLLPSTMNQLDLLNKIADIMLAEATLVAGMERVLDALYANIGLQGIVYAAAEIFNNSIFIHDTAYKILAMAYKPVYQNENLEEVVKLGYIHEANLEEMKRIGLVEKIRRSGEAILDKRKSKDEDWLYKTVKVYDIAVADIAILADNRPFSELDYELIDHFSKIIAIEMQKKDFYKVNKGMAYGYLLADLLSEKLQNQKTIDQRTRILNWKMYDFFQLVVIIDNKKGRLETSVPYIYGQLRQLISDCRWTVYQQNIVIFISRPKKNVITQAERSELENFMLDNSLSAGISNVFTNLTEASRYYQQALHAAEIGVIVSRGHGVYEYSDMLIHYVAQVLTQRNDFREFLHPAVTKIQNYDEKHHTQLLQTLDRYLFFVGNPICAAQALNIHRNTLLYRINKIQELIGLDLDNGDERLKIQLHLKILEFQKSAE